VAEKILDNTSSQVIIKHEKNGNVAIVEENRRVRHIQTTEDN
jgi:hypothetical protein